MVIRINANDGAMPKDAERIKQARAEGASVRVVLDVSGVDDPELIELVESEIRGLLQQHGFTAASAPIERVGAAGRILEKKDSGGLCFVATAACGSADHPTVAALREWREARLRGRWLGERLIALYERVGPWLALAVRRNARLRRLSAKLLAALAARLRPKKERRP